MFNKKVYWQRRKANERGANQGLESHPNYVKPYGLVIKETHSKKPVLNPRKHTDVPKRTSKKERRILKIV